MMTANATIAMSQFVDALLTADGARLSPIQIMIGPVTTGGRKRITRFTPTHRMISARIRYNNPATTIPPHAYCSFSLSAILANIPVSSAATLEKPPRKANEDPRKAGTLNLVHRWKTRYRILHRTMSPVRTIPVRYSENSCLPESVQELSLRT